MPVECQPDKYQREKGFPAQHVINIREGEEEKIG